MQKDEPSQPVAAGRAVMGAAGLGIVFALVGLLVGLSVVASTTLPYILQPGDYIEYQEVADDMPVPRLMNWNLSLINALLVLKDAPFVLRALASVVLFGGLWLVALPALNPTFRLFRATRAAFAQPVFTLERPSQPAEEPASENLSPLTEFSEDAETAETPSDAIPATETPQESPPPAAAPPSEDLLLALALKLETAQLGKAVRILLLVGLPLAAVWLLTGMLGGNPPPQGDERAFSPLAMDWGIGWALRFLALGVALWVGFHRDGLAGDFTASERRLASGALPRLALQGALFGLGLYLLTRWGLWIALPGLLIRYQMLGPLHLRSWNAITGAYLFASGAVWFAAGALLYLIGRPRVASGVRAALLALPILAGVGASMALRPFTAQSLAARLDITPETMQAIGIPYTSRRASTGVPNGPPAATELARRIHIPLGKQPQIQPDQNVLVFYPQETYIVRQLGLTDDNLTATPDSAEVIKAFLQQRDYQSALSWVGIKNLFSFGVIHYDPTAALTASILDMERCPHLAQTSDIARNLLCVCAASPENIALLDKWADENYFAFLDRDSQRMIGGLYRRLGEKEKALKWYRRAEMPKSFLAQASQEQPNFHSGKAQGVLTLNGRPLAGARVAIMPQSLRATPRDINALLPRANKELIPDHPVLPYFPTYHPFPWAFRWISAGTTTDARGAFILDNLTEGAYILLCKLPPEMKLSLPRDPAIHIENAPRLMTLSETTPTADLGTIALTYTGDSAKAQKP